MVAQNKQSSGFRLTPNTDKNYSIQVLKQTGTVTKPNYAHLLHLILEFVGIKHNNTSSHFACLRSNL